MIRRFTSAQFVPANAGAKAKNPVGSTLFTERLAARPVRRLRQGAQASRAGRLYDLAGIRGGAPPAGTNPRPVRRVSCDAGFGLQDLPSAVRQQQVLGRLARRGAAGRDPSLCRSHHDPPGRRDRRRTSAPLWPRRDDLRSWHYVPVLARKPAHCATEPPSRFGYCRVQQLHAERLEAHSAGAAMGDRGMGVVHRRRGSTLVLTRIS
jgi:hypothetical protein